MTLTEKQRRQQKAYRKTRPDWSSRSQRWKAKNPERAKLSARRSTLKSYGLTVEEYEEKAVAQNWLCAICGRPAEDCRGGRLAVDHNHRTGKVRGLLCTQCNAGLGNFQERADLFEKAVVYLRCY